MVAQPYTIGLLPTECSRCQKCFDKYNDIVYLTETFNNRVFTGRLVAAVANQ